MKTKEWFNKRIGKRVYRDDNGCKCDTCGRIVKEGIVIEDDQQAEYLFDVQRETGKDVDYRDKE